MALLCLPAVSHAWWSDGWTFRKEIGFDLSPKGADIAGAATDVPVLIRLSLGNFHYFNDAKPDGVDFRFIAADDKTPLKFHIERFDPSNQLALVWVRLPRLTGGATTDKIYLYYGNKTAAAQPTPRGTYDTNQALVCTSVTPKATAGRHRLSKVSRRHSTAEVNPASLIGGGREVRRRAGDFSFRRTDAAVHLRRRQRLHDFGVGEIRRRRD